MKPGPIQSATRVLGAPSGWNPDKDGECDRLQIRDRAGTMESAWYPTPEEAAAIAAGRPIILTIWGVNHPPVSLNAQPQDADQWCPVHERFENRAEWMSCDDELHRQAQAQEAEARGTCLCPCRIPGSWADEVARRQVAAKCKCPCHASEKR